MIKDFPEKTIKFLKKLSRNNSREWFEENRDQYDEYFLQPAVNFVVEMGEKLSDVVPEIQAVPKIDKSIFRIHRDVRFSKDKKPYKTNMGLFFWEGKGKKESPGFYFHLAADSCFAASGLYGFTKEQLDQYRKVVSNEVKAKEIFSITKKITQKGDYEVGGKHYKKVPKGFDKDYKYADLLLFNGYYLYQNFEVEKLINKNVVNEVFKKFKEMSPLHNWIVKNIK